MNFYRILLSFTARLQKPIPYAIIKAIQAMWRRLYPCQEYETEVDKPNVGEEMDKIWNLF